MELPEKIAVNGTVYVVESFLGKGKGGYSYLCRPEDRIHDKNRYTVKQIHHEPCSYYTFTDKIASEKNDYARLRACGISMPLLIDIDEEHERLVKEYIDGPTAVELIRHGSMKEIYLQQLKEMCRRLYAEGLNIDYYPTNFVVQDEVLYYVDYECNAYMDEWNLENWGIQYWSRTDAFIKAFG